VILDCRFVATSVQARTAVVYSMLLGEDRVRATHARIGHENRASARGGKRDTEHFAKLAVDKPRDALMATVG
jgi:hypothetical protein